MSFVSCAHTHKSHRLNNHISYSCAPFLIVLFVLVLLGFTPAVARGASTEPELSEAQAAIVVDANGSVLYSKNPDTEINMASVTKVMSAVVALDSGISLDTTCQLRDVSLSENAVIAGYHGGMTSSLRDLMRVMLVRSANDAATEVAYSVAGSEEAFVQRMNDKAAELGLTHTHFVNPHGLDAEGHHSSVSDLVTLGRYAMTKYPFIAETVRLKKVTAPVGSIQATFETSDNLLNTYPGMLGIKTGAGDTVTSFLGCARRDNTTLYTCVLGCKTLPGRFSDTVSLLNWAWSTYDHYTLASADQPVAYAPFADHFGLSCVISADCTTRGLVWPDDGIATYQRIMYPAGTLCVPSQTMGVCQWRQGTRVIGTCSYSTRPKLVRSYSGFGLIDQMTSFGPHAGR